MIPRFYIHTLGCKVNQAESETIAASLLAHGWEQSQSPSLCDLAIINTCTVTGEADAKNRKVIRGILKKTDAPVLVTGCAINIDADHYADIDPRVICECDKGKIPARAAEYIDHAGADLNSARILELRATHAPFRTRVDLKIQDGCDNSCSYCIVHIARGQARSVPAKTIIEQTQALSQNGVNELVLVGIDLAAYKDNRVDLAALVDMLQEQTEIKRIRISSVEPQSVTRPLIAALGNSNGRLCRHLHLCLQSGSSKVLEEMNRHYNAEEFLTLVKHMREASPTLALSTDVIVGFPGETDEDFRQTCDLVEQCGFMRLHVFRYSKRPGTPAAARTDQIDPRIKTERSQIIQDLGQHLALEDMQRRLGTHEQVIIERPGSGTSESYHAVACDKSIEVGSLIDLTFTDIDEENMRFCT